MNRALACAAWSLCIALLATSWAAVAGTRRIDPAQSQVGFTLRTYWGQTLEGRFPVYGGEILVLHDGRRRVQLTLSAREVDIVGHPRYTRITRGKGFFDAERYPEVLFVSEPYDDALIRHGGVLAGVLSIRGVRRREVFTVEPSTCEHPAQDCAVIASGTVQRSDYGVDRWSFALAEEVRFSLRIRTYGSDSQDNGSRDNGMHDSGAEDDGSRDEDNGKP